VCLARSESVANARYMIETESHDNNLNFITEGILTLISAWKGCVLRALCWR
jgi:hypothetical protein